MRFNILDFGAREDCPDNSLYIQKAIDRAGESGGTVVIPQGVFISGSIVLRSHITLYLEEGAVLKAGDDLKMFDLHRNDAHKDIARPSYENCDYDGKPTLFFVYGEHLEDVAIKGKGSIDGNEKIFYGKQDRYFIDGAFYPRMPLVYLEDVSNLEIEEVTLRNSAFWTLHMVGCRNVKIHELKIRNNLRLANCDGIDPDHCQNVEISNCDIICADDAIVFKNTKANQRYGDCKNIVVKNCSLKSTSAAIKFGTESFGDFHDIHLENIEIYDTNRGISFQLRDTGNIYDCSFKNISINTRVFAKPYYWGYGDPIAITALNRTDEIPTGEIHHIRFENIICDSEVGLLIYGEKKESIHDIFFDNISLKISEKSKWPKDKKDLRPYDTMPFVDAGASPLYARNASRLNFGAFSYRGGKHEFDVENAEIVGEIIKGE